jgi:hypothetical protein
MAEARGLAGGEGVTKCAECAQIMSSRLQRKVMSQILGFELAVAVGTSGKPNDAGGRRFRFSA